MKALVSGQAGLALLIDGDRVESIHFDSSRTVARVKADIPYLLADATDVIEVCDTTHEKAAAALDLSWRQDRALHLILILLDREADDEARRMSAECLDEFLSDSKVYVFIANRLFSAPLPDSADMMSALLLADSVAATKLNQLLEDLGESQPEIRRRRTEWDALPPELFGGVQGKLEFGYVAVTNGTFRRLAQSEPDGINNLLVTALAAPQFQRFAKYRQIIMSWIKPVHAQTKPLQPNQDEADDKSGTRRRTASKVEKSKLPLPRMAYIPKSNSLRGSIQTVSFDAEYVRRLAGGDPYVEQHFYSYFSELLYIKLRGRVRSPQLIEDVRQETFLRVLRNLRANRIDHPERLGSYVLAVCNNVLLESFRAEGRFTEMNEESSVMLDPRAGADAMFVTAERKEHVLAVLRELPEKDAELLRAVFLEEQNKDEVCRRFGVDRNYLRVLLHRARLRFKELYSKSYAARKVRTPDFIP
jgi:RNA polymerase sigma-70 factor, ECF subfamily